MYKVTCIESCRVHDKLLFKGRRYEHVHWSLRGPDPLLCWGLVHRSSHKHSPESALISFCFLFWILSCSTGRQEQGFSWWHGDAEGNDVHSSLWNLWTTFESFSLLKLKAVGVCEIIEWLDKTLQLCNCILSNQNQNSLYCHCTWYNEI